MDVQHTCVGVHAVSSVSCRNDGQMSPVSTETVDRGTCLSLFSPSDSEKVAHGDIKLENNTRFYLKIRLGVRHLSQIQEESDSREQSTCFLPPIVRQKQSGRPGVDEGQRQEWGCPSDRGSLALNEQQRKLEDNRSLLEELSRIEAELRESLRLDVERQRETEFLRQQENKLMRSNLCYLSLSQRVARPWVSSYFRKFPMHIYCLPVQGTNHRGWRRGLKKRK